MALGSVERARHRLLAWDAGGIFQALRFFSGCSFARGAKGAYRRTGQHRSWLTESDRVFARFSGALCTRKEFRERQNGNAARFRELSSERLAEMAWRSRADGNFEATRRGRPGISDRGVVSGVESDADYTGRV